MRNIFLPFFNKHKKTKNKNNTVSSNTTGNPYVKSNSAKAIWNDRYMNMAAAVRNWQIAFAVSSILAIVLAVTVGRLATESRIQPVAVEVCNGETQGLMPVTSNVPDAKKLVNFAMDQFIMNARTVVADTAAEKSLLDKVYAYSADNTLSFLRHYYQKNNPFKRAAHSTVQATIVNSIQLSKNTWQITFDETKRERNDSAAESRSRWVATLTYKFGKVNPQFLADNPFGIYITQISWSQLPGGSAN